MTRFRHLFFVPPNHLFEKDGLRGGAGSARRRAQELAQRQAVRIPRASRKTTGPVRQNRPTPFLPWLLFRTVNLSCWICRIPGKPGTPWENGFYPLRMEFPDEYPTRPPKVRRLEAGRLTKSTFPCVAVQVSRRVLSSECLSFRHCLPEHPQRSAPLALLYHSSCNRAIR